MSRIKKLLQGKYQDFPRYFMDSLITIYIINDIYHTIYIINDERTRPPEHAGGVPNMYYMDNYIREGCLIWIIWTIIDCMYLYVLQLINTTQHNTTQHNTTQHSTTQHNTTQHNTTQHNTTQHNTTQYITTQHKHNMTIHNTTTVVPIPIFSWSARFHHVTNRAGRREMHPYRIVECSSVTLQRVRVCVS